MMIILMRKIININLHFITNKNAISKGIKKSCLSMGTSNSLKEFNQFLKHNYDEFVCYMNGNRHCNWKGETTQDFFDSSEVRRLNMYINVYLLAALRELIFSRRNSLHIFTQNL